MKAAICRKFNAPLEFEEIQLAKPQGKAVQIRIDAVAICHSDVSFIQGYWGGPLPAIYGHEAAGTILETGEEVSAFNIGDRVIVTLMRSCGECDACMSSAEALCLTPPDLAEASTAKAPEGEKIWPSMYTGAFAEQVLVHESQLVSLPDDIDFDVGALIGCGVITGYGSVHHVAKVKQGETVAVVGCGGVGINAIQASHVAGAQIITAIDSSLSKEAISQQLGATHFIHSDQDPDYQSARAITHDLGYDVVLVAVGNASVISHALTLLKTGGRLIVMGLPPSQDKSTISMTDLASYGQTILGTKMGLARIREDIPDIIALYRQGKWVLDELISQRFDFTEINQALLAAQQPDSLRVVLQMKQGEQ